MAGKILVLGASGQIGKLIVEGLVARGEVAKAASRQGKPMAGAEGVRFDYLDETTYGGAFEDVDRAFLIVPTGYLDPLGLLKPVIAAAATRKVKVVLMTVIGADADDSIPYRRAELELERSGIPFVILRPNWFADNFHSYWLPGIQHQGTIAVPAAGGASSFIDVRDIADSAVAALTSSAFDGKAFNLTGPESLTYAQAAAILSKVAGRSITYTPIDDETFVAILTGAGVPAEYAKFLAFIFHPVREGGTARVTGDVRALTGHDPRPLATYAQDHANAFRA